MERFVEGLASKADVALDEMIVFAKSAQSLAQSSRQAVDGISRFADGARAMGEAAESAAQAAMHTALFWRDRLTPIAQNRSNEDAAKNAASGFADLVRYVRQLVNARISAENASGAHRHAGANADFDKGE